jgi:hemolysin activation/secretion protein
MSRHHLSLNFTGFLLATLLPANAWAVSVNTPSAQPGRVQQELRIEPERPAVGGATIITVPDDTGAEKALQDGASFKLKGVQIKNLTAFTEEELRGEYADKIGKDASLRTLNEIAAKITAKYRNAGYILSRAVVPPQRIANGVVTISIVEGHVNQVIFEGDSANSPLLTEFAEKIRNAKPLNASTLERYLLLIQDLPGMTARAVLRPSPKVPGASDVVVTLKEKPFDGSVTVDNRGTRYLGPIQGGVTVNANNMLGLHERTQFRGALTADPSELQYFQISHDEWLDSEGTKLTVSAGRTRTRPNYTLEIFDIDGIDTTYSALVSHPFIRSRQSNLFGTAGFDIRNTDSESLGAELYGDRLRVGRLGGAYDFVDGYSAINRFDTQLSKGFGWDDDTSPHIRSRINGDTNFWKWTASANRLQPIAGPFTMYFAATGQMASNALLSAEQFGIGGANFGSAYDPSEITGDAGIAGRIEMQYTRSGDIEYIPVYQLYSFYDVGEVWTRNPAAGLNETDSLASTGLGVRFNVMDPLSGNLEVALPMTRDVNANLPNNEKDPRVFFSLAYRY